jgi:hypothetical protein
MLISESESMPILELDLAEADEVVNEALLEGGPAEKQTMWLEAFYQDAERRFLNIYDRARLRAWRIYDRKQAAAHWQQQTVLVRGHLRELRADPSKGFKLRTAGNHDTAISN